MKKILIATDNYLPRRDGITRFLTEIIPRLEKRFEIRIVCPDYGETPASPATTKIATYPILLGDYRPAKLAYGAVKRAVLEADVVFSQTIGPIGALAILAASREKKKVVAFTHSIEWELFPKAIENRFIKRHMVPLSKKLASYLLNKCSLLIVPSQNIADKLTWEGIHSEKAIVHLGVDSGKFKPAVSKPFAKKKLGLPTDGIIIGYHGRLSREKDLFTLLRGFIRMRRKHKNVHLLVVGEGIKDVKERLSKEGVKLVGVQKDVVPWLQAMDIYCLTSLTETTSLSVLEAMSCSLPVISTPVGFVKDYIKEGKNGMLIEKENPFLLAKKIEELFLDQLLRDRMGRNARKKVEKSFDWNTTVGKIEKIFEKMR